jgi:hypothetical protein
MCHFHLAPVFPIHVVNLPNKTLAPCFPLLSTGMQFVCSIIVYLFQGCTHFCSVIKLDKSLIFIAGLRTVCTASASGI